MHTPNWPTNQTLESQVERVRNDGNWIIGDPLDAATRPAGTNDTPWAYPPRLYARHIIDGAPLPAFPGWETPTTASCATENGNRGQRPLRPGRCSSTSLTSCKERAHR